MWRCQKTIQQLQGNVQILRKLDTALCLFGVRDHKYPITDQGCSSTGGNHRLRPVSGRIDALPLLVYHINI